MLTFIIAPFVLVRAFLRSQSALVVGNLALRQQLAVLKCRAKRPRLRTPDRAFRVWLSKLWADWRSVVVIVQPDTVLRWHRLGFKLYWRRRSRPRSPGCNAPRFAPDSFGTSKNPSRSTSTGSLRMRFRPGSVEDSTRFRAQGTPSEPRTSFSTPRHPGLRVVEYS